MRFLLAAIIVVALTAASALAYQSTTPYGYTGQFYTHSSTFSDGRSFGWDREFVGNGISTHSNGFVNAGPYRCLGSGCGAHSFGHYGYYGGSLGGWSGPYYNSKTYDHSYLVNNNRCSGYWRGGCDGKYW